MTFLVPYARDYGGDAARVVARIDRFLEVLSYILFIELEVTKLERMAFVPKQRGQRLCLGDGL